MDSPTSSDAASEPRSAELEEFALTLGADEVPEVLRRVATAIAEIPDFRLLNLVVRTCGDEATACVYYYCDSNGL